MNRNVFSLGIFSSVILASSLILSGCGGSTLGGPSGTPLQTKYTVTLTPNGSLNGRLVDTATFNNFVINSDNSVSGTVDLSYEGQTSNGLPITGTKNGNTITVSTPNTNTGSGLEHFTFIVDISTNYAISGNYTGKQNGNNVSGTAQGLVTLAGNWNGTFHDTPSNSNGTLTNIHFNDVDTTTGAFTGTGTVVLGGQSFPLTISGSITSNSISFGSAWAGGGSVTFTGTLVGNTLSGTYSGSSASGTYTISK